METMVWNGSKWVQDFYPANSDLANILGDMDFDFDNLYILIWGIPNSQISWFLDFQLARLWMSWSFDDVLCGVNCWSELGSSHSRARVNSEGFPCGMISYVGQRHIVAMASKLGKFESSVVGFLPRLWFPSVGHQTAPEEPHQLADVVSRWEALPLCWVANYGSLLSDWFWFWGRWGPEMIHFSWWSNSFCIDGHGGDQLTRKLQ